MVETFLYLNSNGRNTGNSHHIEIWYVEHGGCYYLCSEKRAAADWVKNIQKTPAVTFYIAEREQDIVPQPGTAQVTTEKSTIVTVKALFDAKYGWNNGLFVRVCPD